MIGTLSPTQLIDVVKSMNLPELEWFAQKVVLIRAERKSSVLTQTESDLLLQINQGMSATDQARYYELIEKQETDNLISNEQFELKELARLNERIAVKRAEAIAQLADLRQCSMSTVIKDLGLEKPFYV